MRITFGPVCRVSRIGGRRNPAAAMSYVDQDTLAVMKRLAAEYGSKNHIKLFLNTTANAVWDKAEAAEKSWKNKPDGSLEVFGVTDRKGVYGYAPEGLIESSMDAVEQIRSARLADQWDKSQKLVDSHTSKLTTQFQALEKKYGPKFEGIIAEYEKAVAGGAHRKPHAIKAQVASSVAKGPAGAVLPPSLGPTLPAGNGPVLPAAATTAVAGPAMAGALPGVGPATTPAATSPLAGLLGKK